MVLNSPTFLLFLAGSALLYYLLPRGARNPFLLLAGYVFYYLALPSAWYYLFLLWGTTALTYAAGRYLGGSQQRGRKAVMLAGTLLPLGVLLVFKYFNFFMSGFRAMGAQIPVLGWVLPVGLSFYTFQVIGYVLDVYHGKVEPEKNLLNYALFVSFFAQILSGPIGRAGEMLPQYRETHDYRYGNLVEGLQRFLLGAFKKCVIADGVARIVNGVYADLPTYKGLALLAAVLLYAVQIYMDFSGYSDMAVGVGRVFGFKLRENFNAPYMATNLSGFWKRWHMSLTSWFNDYIFTPLVWSRWVNKLVFGKKWEQHAPHFMTNILIVFLISGLWHGAGLTYVIWGLLNGAARVIEELLAKRAKKLGKRKKKKESAPVVWLKRCGVFLFFAFTLIFFRSPSLAHAGYVLRNLFSWMPVKDILFYFAAMTDEGMIDGAIYYGFFWLSILIGLVLTARWDSRLSDSLSKKGQSPLLNPLAGYALRRRWVLYWFMGLTATAFYMITSVTTTVSFIYAGY